jgi:hypothetical protein
MNAQTKFVSLFILAQVFFASCSFSNPSLETIKGNKNVENQIRNTGEFLHVSSYGSFDVVMVHSSITEIVVSAESNLLPYVETNIKGNELVIKPSPGVNLRSHLPITIYIKSPSLERASVYGSGSLKASNYQGDSFSFEIRGSGDVAVENLVARFVKCSIAGSGDIKVQGESHQSEVSIAGSGNARMSEIKVSESSVNIAGSGDVHVWVTQQLSSTVAGSGDVVYIGDPLKVESRVFGSGRVRKK